MPQDQLLAIDRRVAKLIERLGDQPRWSRAWDVGVKAMVPLIIAVCGWGIGHEIRLSNLELTAYLKSDAFAMEQRIVSNQPPAWFREDMQELKALVKGMADRLRVLEMKK
jgi:hypothetical protein